MSATQHYVDSNKQYASTRSTGQLPMPPSKKVAILTCMDARILPEAALGLSEGEAHVIRNAGGRAPEALRSLIISQQLLGTQEILLIQHTDCGMLTFTTEQARDLVGKNLNLDAKSKAHLTLTSLDFLDFPDLEKNVKEDVQYLKSNELIKVGDPFQSRAGIDQGLTLISFPQSDKITGWVYDVKSGALSQVA
jgi:carbonic anhydrase